MTQASDPAETAGNPPLKRGMDTGFHVALCSFVGMDPAIRKMNVNGP